MTTILDHLQSISRDLRLRYPIGGLGEAEALARTQVQLVKSLHARIDVGRTVASAERLLAGVVT